MNHDTKSIANHRPTTPIPDLDELPVLGSRTIFKSINWLPDMTGALKPTLWGEENLDYPEDELHGTLYRPCPQKADWPKEQDHVDYTSKEIAQWVFQTYCRLVARRISIYNKWRRKVNLSEFRSCAGQYRRACRLAIEQIVRRDLPNIKEDEWHFYSPILPVCELEITFTIGTGNDHEIVLKIAISGAVEVRQRVYNPYLTFNVAGLEGREAAATLLIEQPEWSSSSYSSSSSSFSPF